jgi:hypothetical protein
LSFDYAKTAQTAKRLIEQFGMTVTLRVAQEGTYNPATGQVGYGYLGEDPAEYAVTAFKLDYAQRDIDGTLIQQGDMRLYMDPTIPVTPKTGDTVLMGDEEYKVLASKPVDPAGVVVLHEAQIRGHKKP